jgi:RND family efflux transporter MFP subunit
MAASDPTALASIADAWAAGVWRASWQGGAALALAWLITRAIPRLPARARCWVWRLAYLKLLAALVWSTPVRLPLLAAPQRDAVRVTSAAQPEVSSAAPVPTADLSTPSTDPAAPAAPGPSRLSLVLFLLWTSGATVATGWLVVAWLRAKRLRSRCTPLDDPLPPRLCAQLAEKLGVRVPRLAACPAGPAAATPLLLGPLDPLIVLPPDALRQHTHAELRLMLAHELAHLKRGDLWWNWLPAAAQALFFFHPLVWLAGREWRLAQESACDEAAVNATGARAAAFGEMLLAVLSARPTPTTSRMFQTLPATAAAGVVESHHSVRRRLSAMRYFSLHPDRSTRRRRALLAFSVAVVGMLTLVPWKVVAVQPPTGAAEAPGEGEAPARYEKPPFGLQPSPPEAIDPRSGGPEGRGAGEPGRPDGPPKPSPERYVHAWVKSPEVNVAAPTDGVVQEVPAQVGQAVKKGELLARLDDRKPRINLATAQSRLNSAEAKVKRAEELIRTKQASAAELDEMRAGLAETLAEVRLREQELEETRVVSPMDGVILKIQCQPGEYATKGGLVATVVDVERLSVAFDVGAAESRKISKGDGVEVLYPPVAPEQRLHGRIRFVSPTVRTGSQTVIVVAEIEGGGGKLLPGTEIAVTYRLHEKAEAKE